LPPHAAIGGKGSVISHRCRVEHRPLHIAAANLHPRVRIGFTHGVAAITRVVLMHDEARHNPCIDANGLTQRAERAREVLAVTESVLVQKEIDRIAPLTLNEPAQVKAVVEARRPKSLLESSTDSDVARPAFIAFRRWPTEVALRRLDRSWCCAPSVHRFPPMA